MPENKHNKNVLTLLHRTFKVYSAYIIVNICIKFRNFIVFRLDEVYTEGIILFKL